VPEGEGRPEPRLDGDLETASGPGQLRGEVVAGEKEIGPLRRGARCELRRPVDKNVRVEIVRHSEGREM